MRLWPTGLQDRAHGEQRQRDARLHVEGARTVQPPVLEAHRHAFELAHRPDGVEVAQHQHLRLPRPELGAQVVAGAVSGHGVTRPPSAVMRWASAAPQRLSAGNVARRGLEPHEVLDDGDGPVAMRIGGGEERAAHSVRPKADAETEGCTMPHGHRDSVAAGAGAAERAGTACRTETGAGGRLALELAVSAGGRAGRRRRSASRSIPTPSS